MSGTVAEVPREAQFDAALYIDVMEHIEDDAAEISRVARHIRPGGHINVLAPARQCLFTSFDCATGHYRRYGRASLGRLGPPGFRRLVLRYLDSVGMLASLGNRLVLRSSAPTPGQIALWDRGMVPLSRVFDPLFGYRLGKSILGIWRRDPEAGAGKPTRP